MKAMSAKYNNMFAIALMGLIISILGYLTHSVIGGMVALAFLLSAPGYFVLSHWKDAKLDKWVTFSLSFGLSLLFLMAGGLMLNLLHFIGLERPLTPHNMFAFFTLTSVALLWFSRRSLEVRRIHLPAFNREYALFAASLTVLPLFGAFGAIRLNNGGSGLVTMMGLGLAALLLVLLLWRKRMQALYPYAVFSIGLTVLLALSMRSWFVSGHDVGHEFYLFNQVVEHGFWSNQLSFIGDTYNACMSVTILPAAIAAISNVSGEYVFKILMQVIFALGLIPMFLLAKRFSGSRRALLVSLIFIGFPTFVNDMPFLVRQEVAFVFFSLLLLTAFLPLRRRLAVCLVIAFMAGITLSHYSSGYITLAILFIAWTVYYVVGRFDKRKNNFRTPLLSLPVLLVSLLFTFLWNAQVTATAGTLGTTIKNTITSIFDGSSSRSSGVRYGLVSGEAKTPEETLAEYAGDKKDLVTLVPEQNMKPTALTEGVVSERVLSSLNSFFRGMSAKLLQVLLLVGIAYFFIRKRLSAQGRDIYFYSLGVGSVGMMMLITILPQLSVDYGLTRLFLQTMVIVGVPIIVGLELLSSVARKFKFAVMTAFVALFYLHLSGFIPQLIGGYPPQLTLNNSGYYYDIYYRHAGELTAMEALGTRFNDLPVAADKYAMSRRPQTIKPLKNVADPVTSTNTCEYLYHDYANVHAQVYANFLQGNVLEYSYDDASTRNAVYANQDSHIYKRTNIPSKENK